MKPGFRTTEFWLTAFAQIVSLLVMTGMIPQRDSGMLNDAAGKIAAGVVAAFTLCRYIHGRTLVKTAVTAALFLATFMPGLASAQCQCQPCACWRPMKEPTAFWRHDAAVEAELKAHTNLLQQLVSSHNQLAAQNAQLLALLNGQHQAPAPQAVPQLIVLAPDQGGPRQNIPLGVAPLQQIPLGGLPQQNIPLGGPPLQQIPLGGPPQQQIQLGQPPAQQIPLGTPVPQQIPLGTPPTQQQMPRVPAGPTGYQTYTVARVYYWRPATGQVWHGR